MLPQPPAEERPPRGRRWLLILWPAFVMAGVLEALVFSMVDPGELRWFGAVPVQLTPIAIYSISFLFFWVVIATSTAITVLLENPAPP